MYLEKTYSEVQIIWCILLPVQKHRGKPLLFYDKCPGFFYVHYITHGAYSFTSHLNDIDDQSRGINIVLS